MNTFTGRYHLEIGDPTVIAQGEVGDQHWGHYCFPSIRFTEGGSVLAGWSYGNDDIKYNGGHGTAVSDDGGKTWRAPTDADIPAHEVMMKNGKYFAGFIGGAAHHVDYFSKYTPAAKGRYKDANIFFAEDIEEQEDKTFRAREYDPVTKTYNTFDVTVNWPYMPLSEWVGRYDHFAYPVQQTFALCNRYGLISLKGDLYFLAYTFGFDSSAKSREEAVYKYCGYDSVYVFKSADCGRTWDYLSQIDTDDDTYMDHWKFEGMQEPMMEEMPDGSVVMLIRTGSFCPSWLVRSTDGCKTWSKPAKFDEFGVLPQILTLPCGVTIATYGRPKMKIRATADPSGLKWDTDILFPLSAPEGTDPFLTSCFYTNLLPLDDHTALWIYTDFQYPNENGEPARAIVTRTLTVVPE